MKFAIVIGVAVCSITQSAQAQTVAEKEVLQFERDGCKAFLDADVAALERVLTPDFGGRDATLPESNCVATPFDSGQGRLRAIALTFSRNCGRC
jgi:hypothetical protein